MKSLLELARRDVASITGDSHGFSQWIGFVSQTLRPIKEAWVFGRHTRITGVVDNNSGGPIVGMVAQVTVIEKHLSDNAYPVRNADGEVDMIQHIVAVENANKEYKKYVIIAQYPNESIGQLTFILGEYMDASDV